MAVRVAEALKACGVVVSCDDGKVFDGMPAMLALVTRRPFVCRFRQWCHNATLHNWASVDNSISAAPAIYLADLLPAMQTCKRNRRLFMSPRLSLWLRHWPTLERLAVGVCPGTTAAHKRPNLRPSVLASAVKALDQGWFRIQRYVPLNAVFSRSIVTRSYGPATKPLPNK